MRPVRPGALPTDTAMRFLLVLAAVTAATLYLFGSLWLLFRGRLFDAAVAGCAGGSLVDQVGTAAEQLAAQEQCRAGVSSEQAGVQLAGSVLVLLAAYAAYRLWPRALERRAHLVAADPRDAAVLLRDVDALSIGAGLVPGPDVRLDAGNATLGGFAYGAGRRLRLGMSGGLVVAQVLDPGAFRAIVRHELGHLADGDVRWTYFAAAVWWAFLVLALLPVAVLFAVRDVDYLLRLGWRTVALAGLVALTVTALLRVREAYADARAAQWGSGPDLDRILATAPEGRSRRPAVLRTHPSNAARRASLADPDRLFTASGWAALAAGVAGSIAQSSLADVAYLVAPRWSTAIAALLVSPLLAALVCTSAWRVGLREAVRGCTLPVAGRIGLGLGLGMAIGPVLSLDAAVGSFAKGIGGWLGYGGWALVQVVVAVLLVRWAVDAGRLRVAAALGEPGGPRRALLGHVLVMTVVFGLWLMVADRMLLLMKEEPATALALVPALHLVPESVLRPGPGAWSLLLLLALLVQPMRALHLAGRSWATWFWQAGGAEPTAGDSVDGRVAGPGSSVIGTCLVVGGAAGLVGGSVGAVSLLLGTRLDPSVQASDEFLVAVSGAVGVGLMAACVAGGMAAAVAVPRGWWPLGLLAGVIALIVAGLGAWLTWSAYRFGLLGIGGTANRPLGWAGIRSEILVPAARALVPAVLAVAAVGALRPGPQHAAAGGRRSAVRRSCLAALGGMAAAGLVVLVPVFGALRAEVPTVEQPGYALAVPVGWQASTDPSTGTTILRTIAQDLRVAIVPTVVTGTGSGESLQVGGRDARLVDVTDVGVVRQWTFEVGPPGRPGHLLVVVATERARAQRAGELADLFAAIRWTGGG